MTLPFLFCLPPPRHYPGPGMYRLTSLRNPEQTLSPLTPGSGGDPHVPLPGPGRTPPSLCPERVPIPLSRPCLPEPGPIRASAQFASPSLSRAHPSPVPTRVLSNPGQSPARRRRGERARGRRLSGARGGVLPARRPSPAVGSGSGQRALLLGSCASRTAGAASLPPAQGSCPLRPELVLVWVRRCPGAGRRALGAS